MSIEILQGQLGDARQELESLLRDREGLGRFSNQISSDRSQFAAQLESKRKTATKAAAIANAKAAESLSAMLAAKLGTGFAEGVSECFGGVDAQVHRVLRDIDEEIARLRLRIDRLEDSIADERKRERLRQEEQEHIREEAE